ncbi:hypothetical protein [Streptomyces sp. SID7909]|uniref:hypothetical protein n=1 Tax=Streptomyces sp. SID7909 TaxID=2706092 RepID=UPI0013B8647B|nr:hypothetical protein [Streptomyces sp. SID7909]NEC07305.1 hypothetical protein [Streptomyces sp. SID7909]
MSNAPTYAQLGDAATPEAHAPGAVVDDPRDEIPMGELPPPDFPDRGRFAWRMTGAPARYPNQTATSSGAAGTSTTTEHASRGVPDARRQSTSLTTAGYPVAPERMSTTREERRAEPHGSVSIPGVTPLTAPRAGSTSADPAHTAGVPRYLYDRPFDQWAAHHPPEVSKLGLPSPLASSPIQQTIPTANAMPAPGGVSGVTGTEPRSVWRNTVRMQPTAYDETAVVGTAVQPMTARRWRL